MSARPARRHAVMVLGIARSGTSALGGALAAAGVDFGRDMKPADWRNPRGNFEHFALSRANQRALSACRLDWSSLRAPPRGWRDRPEIIREAEAIRALLAEDFADSRLFGVKDPRLAAVFPIYRDALADLGVGLSVVALSRDRREVLASIRRSGYYHGRLLWLLGPALFARYRRDIAAIMAETPGETIDYATLVAQPRAKLSRLCAALPFAELGLTPDIDAAVASIDQRLHRHRPHRDPARAESGG